MSYDSFSRRLDTSEALHAHNSPGQRLVLHATAPPPATTFKLQFAGSPSHGFVGDHGEETHSIDSAAVFEIS
ncbi:MAG TPA: hypothetical protein VGO47_13125 [Chlamydiales bacterium]|nr:hypothetical protein [Chlamydiales bacterium]